MWGKVCDRGQWVQWELDGVGSTGCRIYTPIPGGIWDKVFVTAFSHVPQSDLLGCWYQRCRILYHKVVLREKMSFLPRTLCTLTSKVRTRIVVRASMGCTCVYCDGLQTTVRRKCVMRQVPITRFNTVMIESNDIFLHTSFPKIPEGWGVERKGVGFRRWPEGHSRGDAKDIDGLSKFCTQSSDLTRDSLLGLGLMLKRSVAVEGI